MKAVQIAVTRSSLGVQSLVVLTDTGDIFEYAPKEELKWKIFPKVPDSIFEIEKLKPVDTEVS